MNVTLSSRNASNEDHDSDATVRMYGDERLTDFIIAPTQRFFGIKKKKK